MPHITTFPSEILQAIFSKLEPKHIKQIRQVCRKWAVNGEPFLLRRAYSALREGTMDSLRQLSDHETLHRYVKEIVVDAQKFEQVFLEDAEEELRESFSPKFRKQEFKEFNAPRAIEEYFQLYDDQERMVTSGEYTAGLEYALKRMPNVTSILVTEVDSTWYFVDGPLSNDVKYAPWPGPPGGVDPLVKVVLGAIWRVRGSQNAARITSFKTELPSYGDRYGPLHMIALTHVGGPAGPRLKTTAYLLRNIKRLSLDLTGMCRDVTPVFGTMIGNAHRLEELELRFGDERLWPAMVDNILIHKAWPLLKKLALEAVQVTFIQMTTILAEHGNLKQLHLAFINMIGGPWEDIVLILSSMRLEGIFLQCLSNEPVNGVTPHCEISCRRDDLEATVLGGRVNGLKAQTDMICPYGSDGWRVSGWYH